MEKSDYQNAATCIRNAIINTEDALCWLYKEHKDREKLHELIDNLTSLMQMYELQAEQIR